MVVGPKSHGLLLRAGGKASQKLWLWRCDLKDEWKFDISIRKQFVLDRRQKSVVLRNRWDCQYAWNTNSRQHLEETEDSLEGKTGLGFEELCLLHEELGRFMQESGIRRLVLWKHSSGIYVENGLVDGWGGHHEAATALKTEVLRAWAGAGEVGLDGRRQWW